MNKSICFAYYADGNFIGWYAGTFGGVRDYPKLYGNSERQLEIVKNNFTNKLKKINETSFDEAKKDLTGLAALKLLVFNNEDLLRGKDVELRVVECPEYDGPNPNFDKEAYETELKKHTELFNASEANALPIGTERVKAVNKFLEEHPWPKCNNWLYADYAKVKEWAKNEPTEFITIIKPDYDTQGNTTLVSDNG